MTLDMTSQWCQSDVMENANNIQDLQQAMAPKLPPEPRPQVRTARTHRRRPRWLDARSL
ncbi:MAG: hypothetical protein JWQ74_3684 [Marmoricola sp.]|jgi:hypothetical protein|nr:hypothetical protein [Marmoricola sp.]